MSTLEPNRVDPDNWFQFDETEMIVCGYCLNADLISTELGDLTGDEVVRLDMVHELLDADEEPYQCNMCNTQNDAYEELDD